MNKTENPLTSRHFVLTKWFIFWLLLTFVGFLFTGPHYVVKVASETTYSIWDALNSQMLRFQIWAVFSLLIVWLDHKFRSKNKSWKFLFPVHLVSGILWSAFVTSILCVVFWILDGIVNSTDTTLAEVFRTGFVPSLVLGVVGYKIILTTNYALDYYKKFEVEKERSENLEIQLAQAQLQALKMQLQPHFLFNTLNSVSNLTLENPRNAVQMIARLGDFLRLTINSNGTQKVSLERELEFLKHYLEIEQIRFQDRLKVKFETAENTLSAEVPNLLLQPLVENAIKHGIAKSMSAGKIKFTAEKFGNKLQMQIENDGSQINGNGFSNEGVGIANTRNRLQQLYGEDYKFELKLLENGGAKVSLEIPFIEIKNEELAGNKA